MASIFCVHTTYAGENIEEKRETKIVSEWKSIKNTKEIAQKWEVIKNGDDILDPIKLKQDIDDSIVDFIVVPKAKQLIKDISSKFSEQYPDPKDRIIAYQTIKNRLILRKNRIDTLKMSEKWKYILREFLDQMIEMLEKKIHELN